MEPTFAEQSPRYWIFRVVELHLSTTSNSVHTFATTPIAARHWRSADSLTAVMVLVVTGTV